MSAGKVKDYARSIYTDDMLRAYDCKSGLFPITECKAMLEKAAM